MKRSPLLLFLCIIFILGKISGSTHDFLNLNNGAKRQGAVFQAPARRSSLSASKGPDTALVADLDGTIYFLEVGSMKPLWSFSCGPQIYSSYQAPVTDEENASGIERSYFIDCGDDWELYAHNNLGKSKLVKSLEEYVSSTPQIADDGGIVLGYKKTTAFLVDAKTGRVMHTYRIPDPPSTVNSNVNDFPYDTPINHQYRSGSNMNTVELPLYITRTDYALTSLMPNLNKVLWNISVAEVGAVFLCQDLEDLPYNMSLLCQSRVRVYRFRNNMFKTLSLPHRPPTLHQDIIL